MCVGFGVVGFAFIARFAREKATHSSGNSGMRKDSHGTAFQIFPFHCIP